MIRRKGFTLIEMTVAAVILACAAGIAALTAFSPYESERRLVRHEANFMASWLRQKMALAGREGSEFNLLLTYDDEGNYRLILNWLGGVNGTGSESYTPKNAKMIYTNSVKSFVFSGSWFTLTPAATFTLKSDNVDGIMFQVTVSGTGYVRVSESD